VRGRADGYDPDQNLIEEVKTYRGQFTSIPDNHRHLHWAQLRIYGHLMCEQLDMDQVNLALVYFDIGTQQETLLRETRTRAELKAVFEDHCGASSPGPSRRCATASAATRPSRAALSARGFPPGPAPARRSRVPRQRRQALPAGAGPDRHRQDPGHLFPALKAAPKENIDKLFFLAAKTPGRKLALDAATTLKAGGTIPLRVLELTARDKACEHPDKACHGDACPLARGFYDRLPAARAAALDAPLLDRDALRDDRRWRTRSAPTTWAARWRAGATWSSATTTTTSTAAPCCMRWRWNAAGASACWPTRRTTWCRAPAACTAPSWTGQPARRPRACAACRAEAAGKARPRLDRSGQAGAPALPGAGPLPQKLLDAAERHQRHHRAPGRASPKRSTRRCRSSTSTPCTSCAWPNPSATIRCSTSRARRRTRHRTGHPQPGAGALPEAALRARAFDHAVLGHAQPLALFRRPAGHAEDTAWIDVESPFEASQLKVQVARHISTRYQHRKASLAPIADLMARSTRTRRATTWPSSAASTTSSRPRRAGQRHPEIPAWRSRAA
jgi:DNA excision repair protein ERCC-2